MNEIATRGDERRLEDHLVTMDKIVTEHLKGYKSVEIAKVLGMSTATVGKYLREWRDAASNNHAIRERADVALRNADEHYNKLIRKAYEAMEDAEFNASNTQKMSAIKLIADLEKARIDSLQKAGLLENSDISKQLVETERKQQILVDILKSTVGPCSRCRPIVQERLSNMASGEVVIIRADEDAG
jgi:predicted transcriptional regulator